MGGPPLDPPLGRVRVMLPCIGNSGYQTRIAIFGEKHDMLRILLLSYRVAIFIPTITANCIRRFSSNSATE